MGNQNRTVKHESVINAMANHDLKVVADPENPDQFLVSGGEIMGAWVKRKDGKVASMSTFDASSATRHRNIQSFLKSLKKERDYRVKQ